MEVVFIMIVSKYYTVILRNSKILVIAYLLFETPDTTEKYVGARPTHF